MRRAVVEGVVGRPVGALEALVGVPVVDGVVVLVVVAEHVVPGDADQAHGAVQGRGHRKVVEEHVAQGDAEGGLAADQLLDHVVGEVVHLLLVAHLRIAEEQGSEARRLGLRPQREVDAGGQGTRRRHARVALGWRTRRLVDAKEARQALRVHRRYPACGLDDEEDGVLVCRQPPTAGAVAEHDVAPVGDGHAGQTALGRIAQAVAVVIGEDQPRGSGCGGRRRQGEQEQREQNRRTAMHATTSRREAGRVGRPRWGAV